MCVCYICICVYVYTHTHLTRLQMENPDFFFGQLPTAPRTAAVSDWIKHTDVCYHISEHFAHKTNTLGMQINKN